MKKILVGIDFSEHSRRALEYGAAFAQLFDGELELVHAVTLSPVTLAEGGAPVPPDLIERLRKDARNRLDEWADPFRADGLRVTCQAVHGSAGDAVRRAASDAGAILIALGTHGRTGLSRLVLGSTAERTARLAGSPVLAVHADTKAPMGFRRIVVATDFSADAAAALEWAVPVARRSGASVCLAHSVSPPAWLHPGGDLEALYQEGQREARRELERMREALVQSQLETEVRVTRGPPDLSVLDVAREDGADMIVTGCKGRSGLAHVLLGSQAERILRRAEVPVVVVKAKAAAAPRR